MSSKSQLDLLVRVRYVNPLPPPPYPPKLLNIPTDPKRFARAEFTQSMSNETPLPMVVDAEMGMPLDLSQFDSLWDGSSTTADPLNVENPPPIDPRDLFMLEGASGGPAPGSSNGINVSWLRKTEYLSRIDSGSFRHTPSTHDMKPAMDVPVDTSIPAQILSIERTFPPADQETIDLTKLKHPTKPDVTAVETYEFLPDSDLWANMYDVFRFAERPGERPLDQSDPRLDCAILRPQESDGEHFLSFYLPKEDAEAEEYKALRREGDNDMEDKPTIPFHWVRDYETSRVEQDIPNEVLLVLDDLDENSNSARVSTHEIKGAYYMNISRKITLKKRRVNKYDAPLADKIDIFQISHVPFTSEEEAERAETLGMVHDPDWLAKGKEAQEAKEKAEADIFGNGTDADGEGDEDMPAPARTNGVHDNMDED
ncbi:hypothetical protein FRC04_001375 [Tulasnella sp. 424]|nr:hypothetical protein FRC04_001375 [Tulasnella sp. 424]KAG8968813.1 hypothetical protein FRC05_001299 [Tulasnella sp. 425]